MITVKKLNDSTYEVTVKAGTTTKHIVNLDPAYYQKLTGGRAAPETLVEKSFEFLLEREPNTSILSRFDLPVINRYFPEYETSIRGRLA